jgi:hypothetical protein
MGLVDTSTYRVETEIVAKDQASAVFTAIEKSAGAATKAVDQVKRGLGLLGVGLGFHEAKKHLFDFNASLEDYRLKMSGMLTLFTKANMEQSWERAGESVDRFNIMATKSALTTKELVNMASLIERPLLRAGFSMNDVEQLTFGAANAAKAFGSEVGLAARDVEYMATRGVHIRDRFAINLLAQRAVNLTPEQFNKLDTTHKGEVIKKALQSPEILEMARKQGQETFHGVMSTFVDNMELMGGRLGMGVFKEVSKEVRSWSIWIDKNRDTMDKFADTVSGQLASGFKLMKSAIEFLVDHADTIMAIGKVWAIGKVGGMLGGGLGLGGGNLSAVTGSFTGNGAMKELGQAIALHLRFPFGKMDLQPMFQKMMGLGSAASALGPAGILGIGYAAHELGEYLGVHRALTAAIDPARVKLQDLKASMEMFDDQVKKTSHDMEGEKGAKGTQSAKNAIGSVDFYKMQLNVLEDIKAGRYESSKLSFGWKASQLALLKSAGFDQEEQQNLLGHPYFRAGMIGTLKSKVADVGARTYKASFETDKGIEEAMKLMTPAQRASIDANKATQLVMSKFMQLFSSSGYGMTGLNAALMSPEEIKKLLLRDSLDPFRGASVNQNITNHISVEVSAKDPDRWLMEVDEKVQRKIRAPSQARGSVITRGGL